MEENRRKDVLCQHRQVPTVFQLSPSTSFHRTPPYLILLIGFGKVGTIWNTILNNCVHNSSLEKQPCYYAYKRLPFDPVETNTL